MALTEEQIKEAEAELKRRQKEKSDAYHREYVRKQAEAEARFWVEMEAKYPQLGHDTMFDIYSELRDFFD